ncbi:uncharacterized protein H6S33_004725 [Morchella sextelata]|uniref:uncharacterized protein n=1 Tax=Morchella sextelata TaxID=1174677 RepID=UPI001D0458CE|nr:uncharacterized protein H6S33_004725 [Morchella sextelata]KAH0605503.1 hypothetical protein H6S33_004725 [Morchella sextelata]
MAGPARKRTHTPGPTTPPPPKRSRNARVEETPDPNSTQEPDPKKKKQPVSKPTIKPDYAPNHLRKFMQSSKSIEEWSARVPLYWAQVFFVRAGFLQAPIRALFKQLLPAEELFAKAELDLLGDFQAAHDKVLNHLVKKVKQYAQIFQESPLLEDYLKRRSLAETAHRVRPSPPLADVTAFGMTELIEIHTPLLIGVPTVKAPPGHIGWLEDDTDEYWEKTLRDRFCVAVGKALHQCGTDPISDLGDNYIATIFKDITPATNSPLIWPPPIPSTPIKDRPTALLLPYCPTENSSQNSGYTPVLPTPPSPPHGGLLSNFDDPNFDFTGIVKDAENAVSSTNQQIAEDVSKFRALRAKSADLVDADIFARPGNLDSACDYNEETPLSNTLAKIYARSNIYMKHEIHQRVILDECNRMDTIAYAALRRKEYLLTATRKQHALIEQYKRKRDKLCELYGEEPSLLENLSNATQAMKTERAYTTRARDQSKQPAQQMQHHSNPSWQNHPAEAPGTAQQAMSPTSAFFGIPPACLPTEHIFKSRKVAKAPPAESQVSSRGDMGSRYHHTANPSAPLKTMRITPERKTSEHAPSPLSTQMDPQSPRENITRAGSRYWPPNMTTAFREPSSEACSVIDLEAEDVVDSGAPLPTPAPLSTPAPQTPRYGPRPQSQGFEDRHKGLYTRQTSSRAVFPPKLEVINENEAGSSPTVPDTPQHEDVNTDARRPTRGSAEISQKTTDVGNWVNAIPSDGDVEGGAESLEGGADNLEGRAENLPKQDS